MRSRWHMYGISSMSAPPVQVSCRQCIVKSYGARKNDVFLASRTSTKAHDSRHSISRCKKWADITSAHENNIGEPSAMGGQQHLGSCQQRRQLGHGQLLKVDYVGVHVVFFPETGLERLPE